MSIYDLSYTDTTGTKISLSDYKNHVILIVNTATGCGLAPQFKDLENLYQKYKSQKFVIIGFPCNQFAGQESVSDADMKQTCSLDFGVSFPLSQKIDVNGDDTHPIFAFIKNAVPNGILGKVIKRNFTKFLVDTHGTPVKRYAPTTNPTEIEGDLIQLLD